MKRSSADAMANCVPSASSTSLSSSFGVFCSEVLCSRNSAKILFVLSLKPKLRFRSFHRSNTDEDKLLAITWVVEIIRGPAST